MVLRRLEDRDGELDSLIPVRPARRGRRARAAARTVAVLPTLCTLANLLCGFGAVFLASRSPQTKLPWDWTPLTFAALVVFAGMVFDALDGRLARLTRNISDLGAQLDSLADMVTFGVAPAFIVVQLVDIETPFLSERGDAYFNRLTLLVAAVYVACAALRLARFNVEAEAPAERHHLSFKGLPSPGAAGTVASMVLLHQHFLAHEASLHLSVRLSALAMVALMLLVAFAMVSRFRYPHLLNRYRRVRAPAMSLVRLVVLALLLAVFPQAALAAGFALYAMWGPVAWAWGRMRPRTDAGQQTTDAA